MCTNNYSQFYKKQNVQDFLLLKFDDDTKEKKQIFNFGFLQPNRSLGPTLALVSVATTPLFTTVDAVFGAPVPAVKSAHLPVLLAMRCGIVFLTKKVSH